MNTRAAACLLALLVSPPGCTHGGTQAPGSSAAPAEARASGTDGTAKIRELSALSAALVDEKVSGVVAVLHEGSNELLCSSAVRCGQRVVPASTFKIPHALVGLETGVIKDADFVISWDGVKRENEAWNRDHTLRSAIETSAVPYFQEVARRVGLEKETEWVKKLAFGNTEVGSKVDTFWLSGPLVISPVEQIDFLQRLAGGTLPVSARSRAIVQDCLLLEKREGAVLRGKTGWGFPDSADEVGWFVGYVERPGKRSYIAVLLFGSANRDTKQFLEARRRVAERSLGSLGVW
jgi:beta-lactamase class D